MLQHYQVNENYSFQIYILFIIYIELGSKISSFFSSRKDETNNTTDENIPTVRKTVFFSPENIHDSFTFQNNTETNSTEESTKPANEEANNTTDNTTTTATPLTKMITIREPLEFRVEILDYADPTTEAQATSIKK